MNNCKICGCEDATYMVATKEGYRLRCESCIGVLKPLKVRKMNLPYFEIHEKKENGDTVMDTTQSAADQQLFTRLRINIGTTAAVNLVMLGR